MQHRGGLGGPGPLVAAARVQAHVLSPKLHSEKVLLDLDRELAAVSSTTHGHEAAVGTIHGGAAASAGAAMSACRRALTAAAAALPSWKPLFARIQSIYDASSSQLESLTAALPQMSARSSQLEAAYRREEEATNFMAEERVRRANAHASLAEERAGELEELLASSRAEAARLREEAEAAERVQASLKESNATLVAAYRRCESSTADSERRSAESAAEAALARRGAEALADELQSYKQQVRTLTRRIKTMVTKADHQHVQSLLQAARQELLDRGHATTAHTRGSVPSGFGERADASSPLGSLDDATSTGVATVSEAWAPVPRKASFSLSPAPQRVSPSVQAASPSRLPPALLLPAAAAPDGSAHRLLPRLQVPATPNGLARSPPPDAGAAAPQAFSPLRQHSGPAEAPADDGPSDAATLLERLCGRLGVAAGEEASLAAALAAAREEAASGAAEATGGEAGAAEPGVRLDRAALQVLYAAASRLAATPSAFATRPAAAAVVWTAGPRTGRGEAATPRARTTRGATGKRFALGRATAAEAEPAATGGAAATQDAGGAAARSAALETLEATAVWVSSSDPLFRRGVPPLPPTHFTLRPRFLVARGASDDVPRFLRSNGLVRAHDLSKQDTERLIKACWSAKGKQEVMLRRQRGDDTLRVAMQDFFWDWLRVTFGGPGQAVEWGSSVVAALQKYAYDADVDVFLRCLQGRLPEDVYTQGNLLVERLEEGLQQRDRAISGGQKTGFLTVDDIRLHVRAAFPHKRPPAMTAVLAALAIDPAVQAASGGGISMAHAMESSEAAAAVLVGTERVDYVRLLAENAVGDQGPFVETLRAQLMSDFLEFTGDLTAALGRVATGPPDDRLVTAATALASIRSEDPAKPEQEVRALVARGLGVHISELDPESKRPVHLRAFLARLRAGWLERSGPLPPHRAAR